MPSYREVFWDIVTSRCPAGIKQGAGARAALVRLAETFSQYVVELEPGGSGMGSRTTACKGVLVVLRLALSHEGTHEMSEDGFAYIPPGAQWTCASAEERIRVDPEALRAAPGTINRTLVTSDQTERQPMPDTEEPGVPLDS